MFSSIMYGGPPINWTSDRIVPTPMPTWTGFTQAPVILPLPEVPEATDFVQSIADMTMARIEVLEKQKADIQAELKVLQKILDATK